MSLAINYKRTNAFSLDRVFDIHFPTNALDTEVKGTGGIPLSVSSQSPTDPSQPDLRFAPIPRVAALRRGLIRQGTEVAQYYEPTFRTGITELAKPAEVKLRFDVSALEDIVREETSLPSGTPAFQAALAETADQLAVYAWQADFPGGGVWLSKLVTPLRGIFCSKLLTRRRWENASEQGMEDSLSGLIRIFTPAGTWVISVFRY